MPGPGGASAGDLYVEVDVEDHSAFERDGADLVTRVHVPLTDAALGAEVRVPAMEPDDEDASLPLVIPPGTQSSAMFTLKGHGIPRLDGRGRGSLVVIVQVEVPTVLTTRARELLEQLRAELQPDSDAEAEGKRAAGGK
jgi:molecular chaperone DnaJ